MVTESLELKENEISDEGAKAPAKMRASVTRRKAPARKRFDRLVAARLKRTEGRRDVVQWLAEQLRSSASYVSLMLDYKTPRVNSAGKDFRMWARLKDQLTAEEVAVLEEMSPANG